MSAVGPSGGGPVVAAPRSVSRRSRPGYLVGLGVALAALLVGMTTMILLSFGGTFTDYAPITAEVPASSTAVQLNSPVEYRDVTVGKVASQGQAVPGGLVAVSLHLNPKMLGDIPANVRATVAPVSIFGNQYIILASPGAPSADTIRSGATVPALQTDRTASLQSTLGDLDHLLIELHPGQLDAALTAVAGALQGQGAQLGETLVKGHTYLQSMQPLWPTVVADLQTLVPVANQVTQSTPDLLGILSNSVAPSQTVTAAGPEISSLFGGGATLAGLADNLLSAIHQPFAILAAASGPFLGDISQNPHEIAQVLAGLDTWAATWTAAEASGPYLSLTTNINVSNPADLGLALLGGPQEASNIAGGLGPGFVNPPTYPPGSGPRLASASGSVVTPATYASAAAAPTPVLSEPGQRAAVDHLVTGLTGSPPESPAVSELLLSPVLESLVGQS